MKDEVGAIKEKLIMGTRGSDLALQQTRSVAERLQKRYPGLVIDIRVIKTKGDILQDVSLAKIGGKGVFVKEIEDALLGEEVDCAVHSMKDMPVDFPAGLMIGAMPEREDPRDVLVSRDKKKIEELPHGARIGTGSLRRRCQFCNLLPDVEVVPLRGNITTRIKKIERENLDGVILAAAGMRRLGIVQQVAQFIPTEVMIPAVGQGALGIQVRSDDTELREMISFLDHGPTILAVSAERAFLKRLGGGCQMPIAAHARIIGENIVVRAMLGNIDGTHILTDEIKGTSGEGEAMGAEIAERILSRGGRTLLAEVYEAI